MTETLVGLADLLAADDCSVGTTVGRIGRAAREELDRVAVAPHDADFASATVFGGSDGQVRYVVLVPARRLTLAQLRQELGPWDESPRLHFDAPRKAVFGPRHADRRFQTRVVARVDAALLTEDAAVGEIWVIREIALGAMSDAEDDEPPAAGELWEPLRSGSVGFGVRSWRRAALQAVRDEVASALGCALSPCDVVGDGSPAYCAATPAAFVRLNAWPAGDGSGRSVFNLVGEATTRSSEVDVSSAAAERLRAAGADWYVPDQRELLEEAGVLSQSEAGDADTIVAILAPRWLAWCNAEEHEAGVALLREIVGNWLRSDGGNIDAVAKSRAELESWASAVAPQKRAEMLVEYYRVSQLAAVERALDELELRPAGQRSAADVEAIRSRVAQLAPLVDASKPSVHAELWQSIQARLARYERG